MIATAKTVHSSVVHDQRALEAGYYRAEIDGLRGVAVITVVAFHAFPAHFPGGYVGVDVFFVISGFLISSIILRSLQRSKFTFAEFYKRRILRIFPALIAVLATIFVLAGLALLPDELTELGKHVASAAVFLSNFTLWQEAGYFDRAAELKPLLHLWSLGVEEQFYLMWPLLLLVLWRVQRQHAASILLVLVVGSLALAVVAARITPTANFYLPVTRFWELGLGCLLALSKHSSGGWVKLWPNSPRGASAMHSLMAIAGLSLVVLAVFTFDQHTPHPGLATLVPTIGTACVILARPDAWFQRRVLASSGLLLIGLISYPLYLWHWPLLSLATIMEADRPSLTTRMVAVSGSVALAWLTFKYIERPIRSRRRTRDAVTLAIVLAGLGSAGWYVYASKGFPERFGVSVNNLDPGPRRNQLCLDQFDEGIGFNYCKSNSTQPPQALFLGDSRAQGLYEGLTQLIGPDRPMMLLARGGCPPLLDIELHYLDESGCSEVWREIVHHAERLAPPVIVIVGGGSDLFDPTVAHFTPTQAHPTREAAFKHGLGELIRRLQRTSRVVYVTQMPQFPTAPSCFLRPIRLPGTRCEPSMDRRLVEQRTTRYERIIRALRAELPDLHVIDTVSIVCARGRCSQQLSTGEILYQDEFHLSAAGGRYVAQQAGLVELLFGAQDGRRSDEPTR